MKLVKWYLFYNILAIIVFYTGWMIVFILTYLIAYTNMHSLSTIFNLYDNLLVASVIYIIICLVLLLIIIIHSLIKSKEHFKLWASILFIIITTIVISPWIIRVSEIIEYLDFILKSAMEMLNS